MNRTDRFHQLPQTFKVDMNFKQHRCHNQALEFAQNLWCQQKRNALLLFFGRCYRWLLDRLTENPTSGKKCAAFGATYIFISISSATILLSWINTKVSSPNQTFIRPELWGRYALTIIKLCSTVFACLCWVFFLRFCRELFFINLFFFLWSRIHGRFICCHSCWKKSV